MGETPFGGAGKSLGATVRPEGSKSRKAGAMKQKAPNSDARESRAVTQVQRREDVNPQSDRPLSPRLILPTMYD